jgi:TFIIF-interacting CTD phosphatase-like protein
MVIRQKSPFGIIVGNPYATKSIVLDLDETLVHTLEDKFNSDFDAFLHETGEGVLEIKTRLYDINIAGSRCVGIIRNGVKEFLTYCFQNFKNVVVWTAGTYHYAKEICRIIFKGLPPPTIMFSRDDCVLRSDFREKPLAKLINAYPNNGMTLLNTIIIDDNSYSFEHCNPQNGILVPHYTESYYDEPFSSFSRKKDNVLRSLINWFETPGFKNNTDVGKLKHPTFT